MRVTETQSEIHGSIRALADRKNAQQSGDTKDLQRRQALWLRRRNPVDAAAAVVVARRARKSAEARK